ncbi:MAG: YggT family protein [Mobilicoccus sp.]|nr:YggT family protein [Mobilicoccus sp.]
MGLLFQLIIFVLNLYLFVLIARVVVEWIQVFARDWKPSGPFLVLVEGIYTLTDPPVRALRRVIPPLRLGAISLDLGFIVLFIGILLLISLLTPLTTL